MKFGTLALGIAGGAVGTGTIAATHEVEHVREGEDLQLRSCLRENNTVSGKRDATLEAMLKIVNRPRTSMEQLASFQPRVQYVRDRHGDHHEVIDGDQSAVDAANAREKPLVQPVPVGQEPELVPTPMGSGVQREPEKPPVMSFADTAVAPANTPTYPQRSRVHTDPPNTTPLVVPTYPVPVIPKNPLRTVPENPLRGANQTLPAPGTNPLRPEQVVPPAASMVPSLSLKDARRALEDLERRQRAEEMRNSHEAGHGVFYKEEYPRFGIPGFNDLDTLRAMRDFLGPDQRRMLETFEKAAKQAADEKCEEEQRRYDPESPTYDHEEHFRPPDHRWRQRRVITEQEVIV